jgi:hypothetical protein
MVEDREKQVRCYAGPAGLQVLTTTFSPERFILSKSAILIVTEELLFLLFEASLHSICSSHAATWRPWSVTKPPVPKRFKICTGTRLNQKEH